MNETFINYGASYESGLYISGDTVFDDEKDLVGGQLGVGIGAGIDVHAMVTKTKTLIPEYKGAIRRVLEWLKSKIFSNTIIV